MKFERDERDRHTVTRTPVRLFPNVSPGTLLLPSTTASALLRLEPIPRARFELERCPTQAQLHPTMVYIYW